MDGLDPASGLAHAAAVVELVGAEVEDERDDRDRNDRDAGDRLRGARELLQVDRRDEPVDAEQFLASANRVASFLRGHRMRGA